MNGLIRSVGIFPSIALLIAAIGCSTRERAATASYTLTSCGGVPEWKVSTYNGGARVQHHGVLYECKPFPFSGWCGQAGYEPGIAAAWADAWLRVDDCRSASPPDASADSPGAGGTSGAGGSAAAGGAGGATGGTGGTTTGACDPTVDNCCPASGYTEVVLTDDRDTFSSSQSLQCVRALDESDTIMAGPKAFVIGGNGNDTINAFAGGTVIPGPGVDTVSVSSKATVEIFDLCEAPSGERLDGGGDGTLISPVPLATLRDRGVIVTNFATVKVQQNSCQSLCVAARRCSAHGQCVEGAAAGDVLCACAPGFSGPACDQCVDVLMQPKATGEAKPYGVASTATPSIQVDLSRLPAAKKTIVSIESCIQPAAQNSIARTYFLHNHQSVTVLEGHNTPDMDHDDDPPVPDDAPGTPSWTDATWFSAAHALEQSQPCIAVTATVYGQNGNVIGSSVARIRRGDFTVFGTVVPAAGGSGFSVSNAHVLVTVGGLILQSDVDEVGNFDVQHIPGGMVTRARAELRFDDPAHPPLKGDVSPLITLDATNPTATLQVPLVQSQYAFDAFEPDDSISAVQGRASIGFDAAQVHNLPTRDDVDVVPLAVASGKKYRIAVAPTGPRAGDVAVALLDAQGNVIAHRNDTPSDFSRTPTLVWTATASATFYVRLTRSDDEVVDAPYSLTVSVLP